jgi:hypothetical protein
VVGPKAAWPKRATRACPVQPTTPLGPDQVNVLLLLLLLLCAVGSLQVSAGSPELRCPAGTLSWICAGCSGLSQVSSSRWSRLLGHARFPRGAGSDIRPTTTRITHAMAVPRESSQKRAGVARYRFQDSASIICRQYSSLIRRYPRFLGTKDCV